MANARIGTPASHVPSEPPPFLLAVHASLLVEGTFSFLVWTRLRFPLVLIMIAFHVMIAILFSNGVLFFNIAAVVHPLAFIRMRNQYRARGRAT